MVAEFCTFITGPRFWKKEWGSLGLRVRRPRFVGRCGGQRLDSGVNIKARCRVAKGHSGRMALRWNAGNVKLLLPLPAGPGELPICVVRRVRYSEFATCILDLLQHRDDAGSRRTRSCASLVAGRGNPRPLRNGTIAISLYLRLTQEKRGRVNCLRDMKDYMLDFDPDRQEPS